MARRAAQGPAPDSEAGTGLRPVVGSAAAAETRDLDRLIHERVRLGIVSALAVEDTMTFTELRRLLGVTDGNLSVHARKLEDGEYITCHKSFDGRQPRTEYRLTDTGRQALERYLAHMETVIAAVRRG